MIYLLYILNGPEHISDSEYSRQMEFSLKIILLMFERFMKSNEHKGTMNSLTQHKFRYET